MTIAAPWHRHVSEREPNSQPEDPLDPAGYEDCVPCSGVMAANGMTLGAIPTTLAEAEALRRDAGVPPGGGMTTAQLNAGLRKRYGFEMAVVAVPVVPPNHVATISGKLSNFPAGHRLRRWDPTYTGGHRVMVAADATGALGWADPLAPNVVNGQPWKGEPVTAAEVRTFAGSRISHTVAPVGGQAVSISTVKGEDWTAKASSAFPAGNGVLRALPTVAAAIVARLATGSIVRTIAENVNAEGSWRLTEYNGKPAWLLYRTAAGTSPDWAPLVPGGDPATDAELVAYIARQPDPTPFDQADLDAATLAGRRQEWERQSAFAIVTLAAKP